MHDEKNVTSWHNSWIFLELKLHGFCKVDVVTFVCMKSNLSFVSEVTYCSHGMLDIGLKTSFGCTEATHNRASRISLEQDIAVTGGFLFSGKWICRLRHRWLNILGYNIVPLALFLPSLIMCLFGVYLVDFPQILRTFTIIGTWSNLRTYCATHTSGHPTPCDTVFA